MASKFPSSSQYSKFMAILIMTMSFLIASTHAHDHHKSSSSPHSKPFEFLKQLEGIKKGDKNQGIINLKKDLQHFGYINPTKTLNQYQTHSLENHYSTENGALVISTNYDDDDNFDDLLETAIKTYQINYNLEPTRTLDSETLSKMMMPRCAVADFVNNETRMKSNPEKSTSSKKNNKNNNNLHRKLLGSIETVSHYAFLSGEPKWPSNKHTLTYDFEAGTPSDVAGAVGQAFKTWAATTHFKFSQAQSGQKPDIRVSFERGDHGDGDSFDGAGGVLAHAFSPTDGRLHFDADESWSIGAVSNAFDIETVALHEIGHILGLLHSSVEDAIMYPQIGSGLTKGLHEDDITGLMIYTMSSFERIY